MFLFYFESVAKIKYLYKYGQLARFSCVVSRLSAE
jgi:hypothetical protein